MRIFSKVTLMAASSSLFLFAPSAMAEVAGSEAEQAEKVEKLKKITDRRHPDYVRCRTQPIMGSLARKKRVCMKNKEWAAHNTEGNRRSKEFVEDMQSGMNASN